MRGADLLSSTSRQIYLQQCLGVATPAYAHLPVAVNAAGEKLSKQTRAQAVDISRPAAALHAALEFLGQQPPPGLACATVREIWVWAGENWQPGRVPPGPALPGGERNLAPEWDNPPDRRGGPDDC